VLWFCDVDNKYIVYFLEVREIWFYGFGYGGNVLFGKKCFVLWIVFVMVCDEGWLAEHMMIFKLILFVGEVKYLVGVFLLVLGKMNLVMLIFIFEGWIVEMIGDDIVWMKFGEDGCLYVVNFEVGFFGVVLNISYKMNFNVMETIEWNMIFINCVCTDDGDVWWEGMIGELFDYVIDWYGNDWIFDLDEFVVHLNVCFIIFVV